jgi:hypothetical protein
MQLRALAPIASIAALTIASASALAEGSWTPVAQTAESVYLLDESSIERRAELLTAWELVEYSVPQYADGVGYRSQMNLRAYRCADRSWDVLRVTRYTGSLHSGEAVLSSSFAAAEMTWHRAAPDSVADFLLQRVCALAGGSRAS